MKSLTELPVGLHHKLLDFEDELGRKNINADRSCNFYIYTQIII